MTPKPVPFCSCRSKNHYIRPAHSNATDRLVLGVRLTTSVAHRPTPDSFTVRLIFRLQTFRPTICRHLGIRRILIR